VGRQRLPYRCHRNDWLAENTSLWLAQFTAGQSSLPSATWPAWGHWQFTDQGAVPGFGGVLDCDRFNGSDENFPQMGQTAVAVRLCSAETHSAAGGRQNCDGDSSGRADHFDHQRRAC
jgi:hypothetical protein